MAISGGIVVALLIVAGVLQLAILLTGGSNAPVAETPAAVSNVAASSADASSDDASTSDDSEESGTSATPIVSGPSTNNPVLPETEKKQVSIPAGLTIVEYVDQVASKKIAAMASGLNGEANGLTSMKRIYINGSLINREEALDIIFGKGSYVNNVSFIDQHQSLESGCEIIALCVAMQAEGFEVTPEEIADKYLKSGPDLASDYLGDPRMGGGGLPPSIVAAANRWLAAHGSKGTAVNLTGTTFEGVADLISLGYPIVVWTTESQDSPAFIGSKQEGLQWYDNEHAVVVYNVTDSEVWVSDSLHGLTKYPRADFARIYAACGNLSMFIVPTGR